jgi:hypothetical protein
MARFFKHSCSGLESYPASVISRFGFCRGWPLGVLDTDLLERGFRKCNSCRRGTFQPNSQRKALTVFQFHPLLPLAVLGFADCIAPCFAGA